MEISRMSLKLVREESVEFDEPIGTPESALVAAIKLFDICNQPEEIVVLVCLNTRNKIVGMFELTRGTIESTTFSTFELYKRLFATNCNRYLLLHNHPSGECNPSVADRTVYEELKIGGKYIGAECLDFLVVGETSYTSFRSGYASPLPVIPVPKKRKTLSKTVRG